MFMTQVRRWSFKIIIKLYISLSLIDLSHCNVTVIENQKLEGRGPIMDKQAIEKCHVFRQISQRKSGFYPIVSPPPFDESVVECVIQEGFPCFPKDSAEAVRLEFYYSDRQPNHRPEYTLDHYCASGVCLREENMAVKGSGSICGPCNVTQRVCIPYKISGNKILFQNSAILLLHVMGLIVATN